MFAIDNETVQYTIPECGHKYHTDCIIGWFRRSDGGPCPYCRAIPDGQNPYRSLSTLSGVISLWKRFARRRTCPVIVKKKCQEITKQVFSEKEAKKELREFKTNNREILQDFAKLRQQPWVHFRRRRKLERELAGFPMLPLLQMLNATK